MGVKHKHYSLWAKNMGTRGHWVASTRAALLRHFRFFSSTSLFGSHYWWSFFGLVWSFASVPTNRGSSCIHPRYSNLVIILIFCCHEFDFHAHLILADFHQRRNFFFRRSPRGAGSFFWPGSSSPLEGKFATLVMSPVEGFPIIQDQWGLLWLSWTR